MSTTAGSLLAFFEDLRSEGVAVGTSEILDAFAALDEVSWTDQRDFRESLAQRLVEIVHMVRQLDLKKPPSIAESIDWARTLLLVGADDIDRQTFEQSMSILVKHRSDIDLVAERVSVKLEGDGVTGGITPPGSTGS